MPTSSQSLIMMKQDSASLTDCYKHRVQQEAVPFPIPRVNVSVSLSSDILNGNNHDYYTVNGYRGIFSFDHLIKSFKWQLLPDPVERKEMLANNPSISPAEEGNIERDYSESSTPEEIILSNEIIQEIDDDDDDRPKQIKVENYKRLLDLGFSVSSFKGMDEVTRSEGSILDRKSFSPVNSFYKPSQQTNKYTRKPLGLPAGSDFPIIIKKSAQNLNMTKKSRRKRIPTTSTIQNTSSTSDSYSFKRTTKDDHLNEQHHSLMSKQKGMWSPDLSVPKQRRHRQLRLRDFFPHNFDMVSMLNNTHLKRSRLTRNPRLRLRDDRFPMHTDPHEQDTQFIPDGQEHEVPEKAKKPEKRKIWKLPTIRMRRELPVPIPGALCFTLKNVSASHEEVKDVIETQLGCKIYTLLFDPVYIHMGDTDTDHKTMWVFTLADEEAIQQTVLRQGIVWDGERSRVRNYDDVMRDENNAYKLYKTIQDEKIAKGLGSLGRRISCS